ncbi:MAG TPA: hypothetical protein VGL71_01150, partial [Urbifossiella sp.]
MRKTMLVGVLMMVALCGCKKEKKDSGGGDSTPPPAAGSQNGNSGQNITPAGGIGVVTNPTQALGGGGGGGAAMAVLKAAKRPATKNELHQIHVFIEAASSASGQMPSPETTLAAIQKEAPKIAEAIKEGVIVLLPARSREEIWAY